MAGDFYDRALKYEKKYCQNICVKHFAYLTHSRSLFSPRRRQSSGFRQDEETIIKIFFI
jgi:hypothetical protein